MTVARRRTNMRARVSEIGFAVMPDPAGRTPRTGPTNVERYLWGPRRRAGLLRPLSEQSRRVISAPRAPSADEEVVE